MEVKYVSFYGFFQTWDLITFLHFGHEPDDLCFSNCYFSVWHQREKQVAVIPDDCR